jgi:hypothetical protein
MRGVDLYVPPAFRVSGKEAAALAAEAAALEQGRDPPTQVRCAASALPGTYAP